MLLLFIAPQSNLSANAEFMRIASGTTPQIVDGSISRRSLEESLKATSADALHFVGHGAKGVLELNDGLIDSADLVSMLDRQGDVKFVFINACNSLSLGTAIHNALHKPVICHDAEINDAAAVRFAERFYREYKRSGNVGESFDAAVQTLARLYPSQTNIPQLINGDMASQTDIADCMDYLKTELGGVFDHFNARLDRQDAAIAEIRQTVEKHNQAPTKTTVVIIALVALVALLQGITPWLNSVFAQH